MGKVDLLMDVMTNPNKQKKPKAEQAEKPKKKKRPSRADEWNFGCQQIRDGLETLQDMRADYGAWKDGMPENLQGGETYQKLEALCDLDLEGIDSTLQEAEAAELPQGFGRD